MQAVHLSILPAGHGSAYYVGEARLSADDGIVRITNLDELARGNPNASLEFVGATYHVAVLDAIKGDVIALCGPANGELSIADAQVFAVAHRMHELLFAALPYLTPEFAASVREVLAEANGGIKPNGGAGSAS